MKTLGMLLLVCGTLFGQTAVFPGGVATDEDLGVAKGPNTAYLTQAVNTATLSWPVSNVAAFAQYQIIEAHTEQVMICSISGSTLTLCSRGFNGTSAMSHEIRTVLRPVVSSWYHNAMREEIQATQKTVVGAYSVIAYGATGDGETDDYTAIAAAITAAGAGGTVLFPPGTYKVNTSLTVANSNVTLRCLGATIKKGADINLITITGNYATVRDCTLDAVPGSYEYLALYVNGGDYATIENNTITSGDAYWAGIYLSDSVGTQIINNRISGGTGVQVGGEGTSKNVVVADNLLDSTGVTRQYGHNVAFHSATSGKAVDNLTVSGNVMINGGQEGFCVEWGAFSGDVPTGLTVTGNACRLVDADVIGGISISGDKFVVSGNNISIYGVNPASYYIASIELVDADFGAVTGNYLDAGLSATGATGVGPGIAIWRVTNTTVSANEIYGYATTGGGAIEMQNAAAVDGSYNTISDNTIRVPAVSGARGIYFWTNHASATMNYNLISGNNVICPGTSNQAGIDWDETAGTLDYNAVIGNNIYNCDYGLVGNNGDNNSVIANRVANSPTANLTVGGTNTLVDDRNGIAFAGLGAWKNGTVVYCSDCNSTCSAGSSTGKLCGRINGAWAAF